MPKEKNIYVIGITIVLSVLLIGLGAWYFFNRTDSQACKEEAVASDEVEEAQPSNFKNITLNGVSVPYPSSWDVPTVKKTIDNFTQAPDQSFQGEYAVFGAKEIDIYKPYVKVAEASSYEKGGFKASVDSLKKTYQDKAVDFEGIYGERGFVPEFGGALEYFAVRYAENQNHSWRGYWFLATEGQDINADLKYISVLYNESTHKVLTVKIPIKTKMSSVLSQKAIKVNTPDETNSYLEELRNYLKTVYAEDAEAKQVVDTIASVIVKFVK